MDRGFPKHFLLLVTGVKKTQFKLSFKNSLYNQNFLFIYYSLSDAEETYSKLNSNPNRI